MADVAAAPVLSPTTPVTAVRPTKPDEALFRETLAKAEKEHADAMSQFNAVKQKIDLASPKKNSDNPVTKRKNELLEQKKEIIAKQGDGKNSRSAKQDEIKRLGDQIKSREKERDGLKELIQYKNNSKEVVYIRSPEVADNLLADLKAKIDSGKLSLLEDRTTVEQINTINRVTKHFKKVDEKQAEIDDLRAKRDEIKDTMNSPQSKELNEKFDTVQAELNAISAEQAEAKKNLSSLFEEKDKLNAVQQEKWVAIKKIKDEYYQQRNAFRDFEREQKQKAWERSRAERERRDKERKLERAQKMLAEASDPAYLDEIRRANSLLQYFDPSFVVEKAPLQASTNLQAQAERKVDDSDLKGVKILSKKDRDEDLFPAQKKGKKGKKHNAAAAKSIFNCPPSVVEDCSSMGIDPPMSAEEVPGVVEKVKAKLEHWKADQAAQTQKNIEKAKKEIEKIEAEEAKEKGGKKSSSGDATPNGNDAASDGEKADGKVEEVTKEVENASIEETKAEAVAAA